MNVQSSQEDTFYSSPPPKDEVLAAAWSLTVFFEEVAVQEVEKFSKLAVSMILVRFPANLILNFS